MNTTRDNWDCYNDVPPISNIRCYRDNYGLGYFAIEADFGGADYANLSYDTEDDRYHIEDPFLGFLYSSDDLNSAIGFFCRFYKLSPEDCQAIADSKMQLGSGEYVASATEADKDFDVFMLMDYSADTGPDTTGMEGDTFDCLGKFFATDLESAKAELKNILEQHPELHECFPNLYVSNYNEYFDSSTREEQDEYGNPYDVDNNVFGSLSALVEKCFDWDYINSWAQGTAEDDELPFDISDGELKPGDDAFCTYAVSNTIDDIELDPDYMDIIEKIYWGYDYNDRAYNIKLCLWSGDQLFITIYPAELNSCSDYAQGINLVKKKIDDVLNEVNS